MMFLRKVFVTHTSIVLLQNSYFLCCLAHPPGLAFPKDKGCVPRTDSNLAVNILTKNGDALARHGGSKVEQTILP